MNLVYKIAEEEDVHIIIMAEPNKAMATRGGWMVDDKTDVAIKIRTNDIKLFGKGEGPGFVWIELDTLIIYGSYVSPNIETAAFIRFLTSLRADMRRHKKEIIVGGDFNAKSFLWNSKVEDDRGEIFAEWLAQDDLVVHNSGEVPTFVRGNSESHLDVTFSTNKIGANITNWKVLEVENLSDHQHITFSIIGTYRDTKSNTSPPKGWRITRENIEELCQVAETLLDKERILTALKITEILTEACDKVFPRKGRYKGKKPVYWWSSDIADLRKICLLKRRGLLRANKGKEYSARITRQVEPL